MTTPIKTTKKFVEVTLPLNVIAWEITEDKTVYVHQAQPLDIDYLRAVEGTLSEWTSKGDQNAYRNI
ncbi:hypothetical protein CCP3SC1_1940002 [Gammaproteobacteria bacterium]